MKITFYITLLLVLLSNIYCNAEKANDKALSVKDILKKIENGENVVVSNQDISSTLDFSKLANAYIETPLALRIDIQSSIVFQNCTFKGKLIMTATEEKNVQLLCRFLKNVNFSECIFLDEVICKSAIFEGVVNFTKSEFKKEVSFEGSTFNNTNTFFNNCTFYDKTKFQTAQFAGNANFMQCNFNDKFSMQNAVCSQSMDFGGSKFAKKADFGLINIKGNLYFNSVTFSAYAIFATSHFYSRAEFMECFFLNGVDFSRVLFGGITRFNKTDFRGEINFEDGIFVAGAADMNDIGTKDATKIILDGAKIPTYNKFEFPIPKKK